MPKRTSYAGVVFFLGLLIGGGGGFYLKPETDVQLAPAAELFKGKPTYSVVRIVDGDTVVLLVDGKEEKVRLIGVDTPETVKPDTPVEEYGLEASRFTKNLLSGESVYVETDPGGAGKVDRYKRTLAFLYRVPDGLFVNLELVRQGYGRVYRKVDFKYRPLFEKAEAAARDKKRGLWAQD